jgi:hypothetical protein
MMQVQLIANIPNPVHEYIRSIDEPELIDSLAYAELEESETMRDSETPIYPEVRFASPLTRSISPNARCDDFLHFLIHI